MFFLKEVSIIIVNYNTKELLKNCILSIINNTKNISYEIIVSDNNSDDGSIEMLESNFKDVIIIKNTKNLGFGKANNEALKYAKGKYIFYLNSDTILQNNSVKIFFDYFELKGDENLGAIGCNLRHNDNKVCFSYGNFGTSKGQIKFLIKLLIETYYLTLLKFLFNKNFPITTYFNHYSFFEGNVDYICGANLFLKNDKNALYDPYYFLYYEEVDLQFNFKMKNLDCRIINGPKIIHLEGGSEKKNKYKVLSLGDTSQIHLLLSSTYFYKKNFHSSISCIIMKILIMIIWLNPFIIKKTKKYFSTLLKI